MPVLSTKSLHSTHVRPPMRGRPPRRVGVFGSGNSGSTSAHSSLLDHQDEQNNRPGDLRDIGV